MKYGNLASDCGFGNANSKKVSGYIQRHHHRRCTRRWPVFSVRCSGFD